MADLPHRHNATVLLWFGSGVPSGVINLVAPRTRNGPLGYAVISTSSSDDISVPSCRACSSDRSRDRFQLGNEGTLSTRPGADDVLADDGVEGPASGRSKDDVFDEFR